MRYIVYFVIQGMSNQTYSDVYAYRFETSDVDIPYITMEAVNPEVSFTTTEDAEISYALFAYNQLPDVFKQEMKDSNLADPSSGPIKSVTDSTKNMTVLEAMLQTKDRSTWESYFDVYASQPLKDTVQEIIQRRQTGGGGNPVTTGNLSTDKDDRKLVDFTTAMQSESGANATYFYCLATAQNALGSAYSFKAVENVHIPDTEPPYLIDVSHTLKETSTGSGLYSGTITLTFNEPIYYMERLGNSSSGDPATLRPIVNYPYGDVKPSESSKDNPSYISIMVASSMTGGTFEVKTYDKNPTLSFTISCTNITENAQITLSNKGVVSDASENGVLVPFIIRFVVDKTGVGQGGGFLTDPHLEVVSGEYRPVTGN